MTSFSESPPEAGMRRMLAESLRAALAPAADREAVAMARAAAQIVGLTGLDACLAVLESRPARTGAGMPDLLDRLEGLVTSKTLSDFRDAEFDLAARAGTLHAYEEPLAVSARAEEPAAASEEPPADTLTAAEALVDLPLAGSGAAELAARVRLTAPVAGALRAALEWLGRDRAHPRPLRLRAEDSVLEVVCEGVLPDGLAAVHDVLESAEASLSSTGDLALRPGTSGEWVVRVPAWSARPLHLMIEQGPLRLALPWHAVLRVSLIPAIEIEMRGASLATPLLPPLAPLESGVGERPVVVLAHGLKRALLVADRLVWRLGADPCEPREPAPAPSLRRAVRSDDEQIFWVAEARVLLRDLPLPVQPSIGRRPAPPPAPAPRRVVAEPTPAQLEPLGPPPGATGLAAAGGSAEPAELSAADVEPVLLTLVDVEPIEDAAPAPAVPPAPAERAPEPVTVAPAEPAPPILPDWLDRFGASRTRAAEDEPLEAVPVVPSSPAVSLSSAAAVAPPVRTPGAREVLIAEDSIAAQQFLRRLFEQRGLAAHVVESAAALREAIADHSWDLVCVDVELPDGRGRELMQEMRTVLDAREIPCVALVRDDDDAEVANDCGIRRWLRKPFDRDEVGHLLTRLGLIPAENS